MSDPKLPRAAEAPLRPSPTEERGGPRTAAPGSPPGPERGAAAQARPPAGAETAPAGAPEVRMPRSPHFTSRVWDAPAPESGAEGAARQAAGSAPTGPAPDPQTAPPPKAAPAEAPGSRDAPARAQPARDPRPEVASLEDRLKPRGPLAPAGMSDRSRFLVATLFGMVLAVGVHIAIVLALPHFAENDAFSRLRSTMEAENAVLIAPAGGAGTWVPLPDPAAAVAACAYDLRDGPVRVSAKVGALLQSLSFHARGGGVYFAVTDRAAVRGELDLVVMTRRQLDEALAAEDEADPTRDVRIVAPRTEGFVIVRVLAPAPSLRPQAEQAARSVACTIEGEDQADPPPAPPPAAPPAEAVPPAAPQPNRPAPAPAPPGRR